MNIFRFRFESVLRYRKIIEENKNRDFGIALSHLKHEETNLEGIKNSISYHEELIEKSASGMISAHDLENKLNYAHLLDDKRESQEKQVKKAEDEVELKRTELANAAKKKKIFERLKEHDHEDYNDELRKEEQALIDELTSQRKKT